MNHSFLRPPFDQSTPTDLLAYYRQRQHVQTIAMRDAEQASDAIVAGVLENRFTFNGESHDVPDPVSWTRNPSVDVEWLILLHKFYYAVGLGDEFQRTGDLRYLERWLRLTESWIDQVALDFLSSDVMGRRVQNWLAAHTLFVKAPHATDDLFSPAFHHKFLQSIHQQVSYLCTHLTPARNHRTIELYAIFMAAVLLPELKESEEWLKFARHQLHENLRSDLLPDGVQCELSTDYHHLVLRNYLGIMKLAKLNNIPMPNEMNALLQRGLEFAKYIHKPDGLIPALSDGDSRSFYDVLLQGYQLYGDQELRYVATQGQQGVAPKQLARKFAQSGYVVLRSGWGDGGEDFTHERFLVFDCGPLGAGNHGHLDLLNFEMAAYGQSLIVDPGRYTYYEPPIDSGEQNWRVQFRGTSYHNTVQVDDYEQTRYLFHKNRYRIQGPAPEHELRAFVSTPTYDFVHGVAASHEYPVIHERKILFARPDYWIISDILRPAYREKEASYRYHLNFHLSQQAQGKTTLRATGERTEDCIYVDAPNLFLVQPYHPQLCVQIEEGFVSQQYGVKHPAPIVRFIRNAEQTVFHTIVYPYQNERPQITVKLLPVKKGKQIFAPIDAFALCVTIQTNQARWSDYYFSADLTRLEPLQMGNFEFAHLRSQEPFFWSREPA